MTLGGLVLAEPRDVRGGCGGCSGAVADRTRAAGVAQVALAKKCAYFPKSVPIVHPNRSARGTKLTLSRRSLSVLTDLRPAFDGHYGIPQETRLMFPLLGDLDDIEVTGLIWHPGFTLTRGLRRHGAKARNPAPAETFRILSRLVASATKSDDRFRRKSRLATALRFAWLQLRSMAGSRIPVDRFDGAEFGDFLWQNLFAMTLPPDEFERCRVARYATLSPPWSAMHATAFVPWPRRYAKIDTAGYDVLLSQTPWPGTVDPSTQLVVRYHDAVPVFLPHTLKQPQSDQFFHMSALQANAKAGAFACVSDHSRTKLL